MVLTCLSPQNTGWSALHFSAERGDWDTTQALLQAGASPHLKDKVCGSSSNSNHLPSSPESLHPLLFDLSLFPVKNGLTALEIAEVKAEEGEEGRQAKEKKRDHYMGKRPDYNYEGVISLLREHSKEEPSAKPSHHVSINLGNNALHNPHYMCLHVISTTSLSASNKGSTSISIISFFHSLPRSPQSLVMTVLLLHNRTALLLIRTLLPLNRTSLTPPRSPLIRHHGEGEYLKLAPTVLQVNNSCQDRLVPNQD